MSRVEADAAEPEAPLGVLLESHRAFLSYQLTVDLTQVQERAIEIVTDERLCDAVISGVYKQHHLEDAQHRGLTLFWSHGLDTQLLDWLDNARTPQ